jgi:HlyD family secretion protein
MDQALSTDFLRRRSRLRAAIGAAMLVVFCAAALGINHVVRPSVAASDIVIAQVRKGDIDDTINASGVVIPVHEEVVTSPGTTRVIRVHAKPGQQVRQGDLLLELDDHEARLALEALKEQLAQQENRITALKLEMEQKLKQTASSIELLEIDLRAARARFERNQKLRDSGLVSGEDMLTGELNVKRSEIQLRQQRELMQDTRRATSSEIAAANLQKAILQKQIAQQEQVVEQTRVKAPFSGMLTALLEEEGASVASGQLVARVSELNNYRVEATLSDFHARQLAPGQAARIEQNGVVLAGRVHTILPEIQDGTIKLLIDLAQPHNAQLRNKMRVDVDIVTGHKAGTLLIDSGQAFNGKGPQPAFAVQGGIARKTTLDLGGSDGKVVEIRAGARLGDRFIISDTKAFKDLDSFRISE